MLKNLIKYISIPNNARVFFVGDIHGMYNILEKLLISANFDKSKDILIATGDLIDRGDFSHLAIDYLNEPWFISIFGNHEKLLCEYVLGLENNWKGNGGLWDNFGIPYEEFYKEFIELPALLELNFKEYKIGVVHAGVPDYIESWEFLKRKITNNEIYDQTLRNRKRALLARTGDSNKVEDIDLVVSGHTINNEIILDKNQIFIDTGGFYHGKDYCNNGSHGLSMIEVIDGLNILEYRI